MIERFINEVDEWWNDPVTDTPVKKILITYGHTRKESYSFEILQEIQSDKYTYPEFRELTKELREEILTAIKERWPEELV